MIQRIQLYKLDGATAAGSAEPLARALEAEVSRLPGAPSVAVGLPSDAPSAKSWDLSLVLSFADGPAAEAFLEGDSLHDAVRRALGASIVVEKGWSFAVIGR